MVQLYSYGIHLDHELGGFCQSPVQFGSLLLSFLWWLTRRILSLTPNRYVWVWKMTKTVSSPTKKNKQTNIFPSHNFCLDCHCWCFHPLQISIIPPHLFTELHFAFKDSGAWGDWILSTSQLPTSDDLSEYRISCMQITHFLRLKPLKNPF